MVNPLDKPYFWKLEHVQWGSRVFSWSDAINSDKKNKHQNHKQMSTKGDKFVLLVSK